MASASRALRLLRFLSALVWLGGLPGCAVLRTVLAPQEWSENYALMPGTIAEWHWLGTVGAAPNLVDGDPSTTAETSREVVVRIPEPRPLRRIVLRDANYEDVLVYVGGRSEGEWKMVAHVQQNRASTLTIPLNSITDRIRLRIGNTLDDKVGAARPIEQGGSIVGFTTFQPGKPRAGEIELYGLRTKKAADDDLLF
jgi:hypothetical protein